MTVLLIDSSEIYISGMQSFLKKINTVQSIIILSPGQCSKADITVKVDVVLCDFASVETPEFSALYKTLSLKNNSIKLIPTVHSVKDLDFSIFNKHNTAGIIYKSIPFRNFEFFMLSLSGKAISNNFVDLLDQFAIEKRISNRLDKKYRFQNILINDEMFSYDLNSLTSNKQLEAILPN